MMSSPGPVVIYQCTVSVDEKSHLALMTEDKLALCEPVIASTSPLSNDGDCLNKRKQVENDLSGNTITLIEKCDDVEPPSPMTQNQKQMPYCKDNSSKLKKISFVSHLEIVPGTCRSTTFDSVCGNAKEKINHIRHDFLSTLAAHDIAPCVPNERVEGSGDGVSLHSDSTVCLEGKKHGVNQTECFSVPMSRVDTTETTEGNLNKERFGKNEETLIRDLLNQVITWEPQKSQNKCDCCRDNKSVCTKKHTGFTGHRIPDCDSFHNVSSVDVSCERCDDFQKTQVAIVDVISSNHDSVQAKYEYEPPFDPHHQNCHNQVNRFDKISEDVKRNSLYDNCTTGKQEEIITNGRRARRGSYTSSESSEGELEDVATDAGEGVRTDESVTNAGAESSDDYCQTDECGEDCDYCSGEEAEDEDEGSCQLCHRNRSVSCKHSGVLTNGILKSFGNRHKPVALALEDVLQKCQFIRPGLEAIRESSITSEDVAGSDDEVQSLDGSTCDLSSSWHYGLCRDPSASRNSTLRCESDTSTMVTYSVPNFDSQRKANSLPITTRSIADTKSCQNRSGVSTTNSSFDEECGSLPRLPPRHPKSTRLGRSPTSSTSSASPVSPRPSLGLLALRRSPLPRQVSPRSPSNPNPPYGFSVAPERPLVMSGPTCVPGDLLPPSPRTNCRIGAVITRNFSISDDDTGSHRSGVSRRHVTISRHEATETGSPQLPAKLSSVDPNWVTWKLGVLQKTIEEVNVRLEDAEKSAASWGPIPQDANLAEQHAHNVRKYRENLLDLQRGIDDVNDQAARFSAHNVPLIPANSAKLHDLNNRWKTLEGKVNDRWRQVIGRSREVTPLCPSQLAYSVSPPWERSMTNSKVPYYINHEHESTHWDHPIMMDLLDSLSDFNHIKFSAYRTASKLRRLQKKISLDRAKLQMVTDIFDEHGLRGQNDRLLEVGDMLVVLAALYGNVSADHTDVNGTVAMDLCLNWLLNVFDSQRTGQMRVLSFKIGLVCLCRGHLEDKYRYLFRLIADPNRLVDQRKLGLLLHDCLQIPRLLGEVAAFGGSNIEPSVRSCFSKAGKEREAIEAVHFLAWVQQEPQSLVWLAVLHRVAASEILQHQVKCNVCKSYPMMGLRYRCLKCLSFDMCQQCFFDGRSSKSHKITHPMHEYCTATTTGEDMKDFTKALKNKFKSKRSLQKHTKKGYLPVQTVLEGDMLESQSPQHGGSGDMHSRLEVYASRLAEVELRTNSNSTPESDDEHGLIAQYCQTLTCNDALLPVPRSPMQIMVEVDAEQKDELEQMIRDLEEENCQLQAEYDRLRCQHPMGSSAEDAILAQHSEAEMLAEAKLLREHKDRLEARMTILEEHNHQLETQLHRLKHILGEPTSNNSPNRSGTLQTKSVTASQLAVDSPAKINGHSNQGGIISGYDGLDQVNEYVRPPPPPIGGSAHVGNLFSRAGDLGRAVGSLVATMNPDQENDSLSDDKDDMQEMKEYDQSSR